MNYTPQTVRETRVGDRVKMLPGVVTIMGRKNITGTVVEDRGNGFLILADKPEADPDEPWKDKYFTVEVSRHQCRRLRKPSFPAWLIEHWQKKYLELSMTQSEQNYAMAELLRTEPPAIPIPDWLRLPAKGGAA